LYHGLVYSCIESVTIDETKQKRLAVRRQNKGFWLFPFGFRARSAGDEPLLALVDEEVGDDGRPRRPQFPARRLVPGLQLLKLRPARRGGEQGLQLLLPLLESFFLSHRHPLGNGAGGGYFFVRAFFEPGGGGADLRARWGTPNCS